MIILCSFLWFESFTILFTHLDYPKYIWQGWKNACKSKGQNKEMGKWRQKENIDMKIKPDQRQPHGTLFCTCKVLEAGTNLVLGVLVTNDKRTYSTWTYGTVHKRTPQYCWGQIHLAKPHTGDEMQWKSKFQPTSSHDILEDVTKVKIGFRKSNLQRSPSPNTKHGLSVQTLWWWPDVDKWMGSTFFQLFSKFPLNILYLHTY
jgi:hypothetical protein